MNSVLPQKSTKQSLLDWTQPFCSPAALLFFCISVFLHVMHFICMPQGRGMLGPLPFSAPSVLLSTAPRPQLSVFPTKGQHILSVPNRRSGATTFTRAATVIRALDKADIKRKDAALSAAISHVTD